MGLSRLIVTLWSLASLICQPALALVRFECGTHRIIARLEQRDLVLYPGSFSEERLSDIVPPDQLSAIRKKGIPDRTHVRARIRISSGKAGPDGALPPSSIQLISIEEPSIAELEKRDSTAAIARESSEGCKTR